VANIRLQRELQGRILDIGGGGEGVIGRLYGRQVCAIDHRQEELDEAPEGFEKRCMDARNLQLEDTSFDHVTFFYSLMYMDAVTQQRALREVFRVLRPGGGLHLWDAVIEKADPFIVHLDIDIAGSPLSVDYGVYREEAAQNAELVAERCRQAGFHLVMTAEQDGQFCQQYIKGKDGIVMQ
jgi:ubiquinone/menaquinone biosynthesis C-methylase UbiE